MAVAKAVGATPAAVEATVTLSTARGVAMSKSWVDANQVGGGPERCNRAASRSGRRYRTGSRLRCRF
jgi:hypothetical protein